jgi:hypothetical protein
MWYSTANVADLNLVKEKQTRYSRNIVFLSLLRSSRPSNIIVITRTPFHWQWLSVWSTWENISEIRPQSDVGRSKHHYNTDVNINIRHHFAWFTYMSHIAKETNKYAEYNGLLAGLKQAKICIERYIHQRSLRYLLLQPKLCFSCKYMAIRN